MHGMDLLIVSECDSPQNLFHGKGCLHPTPKTNPTLSGKEVELATRHTAIELHHRIVKA